MKKYAFNLGMPRLWLPPKILLIMKLIIVIMTTCLIQVSAAGFAQKVTLKEKEASLRTVLQKIRVQTGYDFIFDARYLENTKKVNVDIKNGDLEDALNVIFKDQDLDFSIKDRSIVLKPKEKSLLEQIIDRFVQIDVKGRIVDEQGNGLPGASVKVKGINHATSTDNNGAFILKNVAENAILEVSYVGYIKQEIKASKDLGVIHLVLANADLQEVTINKGYYTTTKEFNTGNVSTVTAADIAKQPVSNPIAALEGRVPGLYISQNSGLPGSPFTVQLRGQNSIANGNDPLFIVDGIPFTSSTLSTHSIFTGVGLIPPQSPFNSLSAQDIESIEVLKDADATAIYGSRGANGVILITTKKGKAGKTNVDVNLYSGAGEVTRKLDLMNTDQYLMMRNEAFKNDSAVPGNSDYDLNGAWDSKRYTDWQDLFIGGTAAVTDGKVTISGGNTQTQFTLGGGLRNENTVFPGDFYDKKISFHAGIDHTSLNQKFKTSFSASYVNDDNHMPTSDLTSSIVLPPNAPALYDEKGNLNWQNNTWNNPFALLEQQSKSITNNLVSNLMLSYKLLPGLIIKTNMSYNSMMMKQDVLIPLSSLNPSYNGAYARRHMFSDNELHSWIIEPQINYSRSLGDGQLDVVAGSTFQDNTQTELAQSASNFPSDALIDNVAAAAGVSVLSNIYNRYKYNALYGRVGYNWKEKYIVNLTARRDGSSRFGPGKQFGNFGAAGAAWLFSKENFIKDNLSFLSFGKLRASYGTTGNDQFGNYQYLSTYSYYSYNYQGINGLQPEGVTNPDFRWEVVKKLEAGLELGFLQDRITLNSSWYRNRTGNQLVGYALPSIVGFPTVQYNLPAVIENKGLEFELNTINIRKKNFSWNSSFNISFPKNKLVSYPNLAGSSYVYSYAIGQPLSVSNLFHSTGVDPQTGVYTFTDKDGDEILNYYDDQYFVFVGQKYFGGLQNDFTYKQFQLSFFVQFVKQTGLSYLYNGVPGTLYSGNQPVNVLDRWQKPGDITSIAQFSQTYGPSTASLYQYNNSDGLISDASFLRLKNVSLSWQAPKKWIDALHLQNLRIYAQSQNLFTITGYKGLDPENPGGLYLPPLRFFTGGIQLTL